MQSHPSNEQPVHVIGIDVHSAKDCPYAVINRELEVVINGWLASSSLKEDFRSVALSLLRKGPLAVAVDAPRAPLSQPRNHYFLKGRWRLRRESERGFGRHCELVLNALGLANPQWTRLSASCPKWMNNGFELFGAARELSIAAHEVFPSASYAIAELATLPSITVPLVGFSRGAGDMFDAAIAAYTGMRFEAGLGSEVGGGDGLGTIILPVKLSDIQLKNAVHRWPTSTVR